MKKHARNAMREITDIENKITEYFSKMDKKIKRKKISESDSKVIQKLEKDFKQLQPLKNQIFKSPCIKNLQENVDVWSEPHRQGASSFAAREGLKMLIIYNL